jgi:predicted small secreted protein
MTKQKGAVMKNSRIWAAVAVLAVAGLAGCASTQVAPGSDVQAAAEPQQVSRPAPTYGSMGGYRFRRLVATPVASS